MSIRTTEFIPMVNIKMDRWPICPQTLDLANKLNEGLEVPPIHVALTKHGQYKICDGRHRVTAYKLLGRSEILATYSKRKLKLPDCAGL